MAEFIDINKKIHSIPDRVFSYRSISLNKPESRASRGLNSREAIESGIPSAGGGSNNPVQLVPIDQLYQNQHLIYNGQNAKGTQSGLVNQNVSINSGSKIADFPSTNNSSINTGNMVLKNQYIGKASLQLKERFQQSCKAICFILMGKMMSITPQQ